MVYPDLASIKNTPWRLSISLRYKTVHILFPARTRVYAFYCAYVQRISLRGLGVVPTVDIAHYEYHYLSSVACAENRAIAPLIAGGTSYNTVKILLLGTIKQLFSK